MVQAITKDTQIDDIINQYPEAIQVFMRYCLHCIGCPISRHHSVENCAVENDLDLDALLADLNASVLPEKGERT